MSFKLRPYQQRAADLSVAELKKASCKPFIIQAATGAGKSLIIAEICHQLNEPVLILQPSREILLQNYQKLESYGMTDISMYSASVGRKEIGKYTYATVGSIYKKAELFLGFKYVIIDECHGVDPKNLGGMYKSFLDAIECSKVCGLTATPYRILQKFTREGHNMYYTATLKMVNRIYPFFFKKIIFKIETAELIEQGYLCPIEYFKDEVDTTGLVLNTTGADFTTESLEKFWNTKRLRRVAQALEYSHQNNQRTLVFCSSIRMAENCLELARHMNLPAAVVTGKTTKVERERIISEFKTGKIRHLLNVGVFTVGFDMPVLDCIVLARPTISLALYYQMIGRGVRIDPDNPTKVLQVYDLAGVVESLGRVETIKVKTENHGFRDEVWSEVGRMDERPLFKFFVKRKIFKEAE